MQRSGRTSLTRPTCYRRTLAQVIEGDQLSSPRRAGAPVVPDPFIQRARYHRTPTVPFWLPAQPVDATQALNLSAGVSNPKVSRGRSLSWRATLFRWVCEYTDKSVPFGKYCLSRPLVFSLEPRCHGLCGSEERRVGKECRYRWSTDK